MPAGVSWPIYLKHATIGLLTMFAGAQTVHMIYRPLDVCTALLTSNKLYAALSNLCASQVLHAHFSVLKYLPIAGYG